MMKEKKKILYIPMKQNLEHIILLVIYCKLLYRLYNYKLKKKKKKKKKKKEKIKIFKYLLTINIII